MPWCPNCKAEYREGYFICSDCKVELVENLEPIKEAPMGSGNEAYLMTVPDTLSADLIESLLSSYEIPIRRRNLNAGGYIQVFTGFTNSEIDIFVPEAAYQEATEIVNGHFETLDNEMEDSLK